MKKSASANTISPLGTPNSYAPYRFPLHDNIEINPPEGDMVSFFVDFLGKAIDDQLNSDVKKIYLKNGRLLPEGIGGVPVYEFDYDGTGVVIEDARIRLVAEGKAVSGMIMSVAKGKVLLTLDEHFPVEIEAASMIVDNTSLLKRLRDRYESINEGETDAFNTELADISLGIEVPTISKSSEFTVSGFDGLNSNQKEAVEIGLGSNLLYLWGPPGTGKSATLSVLIRQLYNDGKRVLIASNTNFAIDGVFKSVVKALDADCDSGLKEGHVLRLGDPYDQDLAANYLDQINPNKVVERKTRKLEEKKDELHKKVDHLNEEKKTLGIALKWYERSRQLASNHSAAESEEAKARREHSSFQLVFEAAKSDLDDAEDALQKWMDAGAIRRLLMEKRETLEAELLKVKAGLAGTREAFEDKVEKFEKAKSRLQSIVGDIAEHDTERPAQSEKECRKGIKRIEEEVADLDKEIQTIVAAIREVLSEVMAACQVLAATVHQVYMRPKWMEGYDVVVVDEASMIQLPVLYHCCGMADEKVVIAGDFRQLPPIADTQEKAIWRWTGCDVFEQAGVVKAVNENQSYPGLVLLNAQYRMDDKICQCISNVFYSGKLVTGEGRRASEHPSAPDFISDRLLIVDTTSASPYCQKPAQGSGYNLFHSAASLEIVKQLEQAGFLTGKGSVGICTPNALQKTLTREVMKGAGYSDFVTVGTVHTYQGDEKELMILDVIDGNPQPYAGVWSGHDELTDDGAKLFNVAVSRAKEYLVVLANLRFLEEKLPSQSILRGILHDMQERGQVVDVIDLLGIDFDAEAVASENRSGFENARWYTEKDFYEACHADMANATSSIVVFSGFITEKRIDKWFDLLANKVRAGVRVKCITRPPRHNVNIKRAREALHRIRQAGVTIDIRRDEHQKVVLIDGKILWLGSLNPLSFTRRSREIMARVNSPKAVQEFARLGCLEASKDKDKGSIDHLLEKENPDCPQCKGLTSHEKDTNFRCIDCGFYFTLGGKKKGRPIDFDNTPQCEKCGMWKVRRKGKYGEFWACPDYRDCDKAWGR